MRDNVTISYEPGTKRSWRSRAPKRVVDYSIVSEVNWARLAAYMDGEGCFAISSSYNRRRKNVAKSLNLYIAIGNTDIRLCQWLEEHFGGSTTAVRTTTKRYKEQKMCFTWRLSGYAIDNVLQGMFAYLVIKKEQAQIAMSFRATFGLDHKRPCHGNPLPQEVRDLREELKQELQHTKRVFSSYIGEKES